MHTVYLFDSEKGGVGKSTFCKVFVQYLIDNGVDFKLFDADFTNQDVLSAYSDIGGEALNLAKDERLGLDADKIFAAARDTNVVVNFPANIAIIFNRWLEQTGVLEMQKAREMRFVKIFVTTHEFSCIQALKKSLNQWGKSMSHVVVQNIHTAYQETYDEVFAIIKDSKSAGTNGGTIKANDWTTRVLNTIEGSQTFAILNSDNTFTVKPGLYKINIRVPGYRIKTHKCRLYSMTDDVAIAYGNTAHSNNSETYSMINHILNIDKTVTYRVDHICSTTRNNIGLGIGSRFLGDEIYTEILIQKL